MMVERRRYPARYDDGRETVGGPLLPLSLGGLDETFAAQAFSPRPAARAPDRRDRRPPSRGPGRRHSAAPRPGKKPLNAAAASALAFAALMAATMAAIAPRNAIVAFAPATAAVYAGLGMPVNLRGLEIDRVRATAEPQSEEGQELLVTGEIVNLRDSETPVPELRLALRGEDGRELYAWTARGPKSRLFPHERAAFRARLAAPSPGVRDVLVKFAAPGDKASFTE
jgi:hypothetical protein